MSANRGTHRLSEAQKAKIVLLRRQRIPSYRIAERFGIVVNTVYRVMKEYRGTEEAKELRGMGKV